MSGGGDGTESLSFSRVNRYLHCPEQYRLYYVEQLRPKIVAASLVFGQVVHEALARLFRGQTDPVDYFATCWTNLKDFPLTFSQRDSWDSLGTNGRALLTKFVREEMPRIADVRAVEKFFRLRVNRLDRPFVGVVDLVAGVDHQSTVVDFKTAAARYPEHEAALSDQLTAYQLAEPTVERAAFCVLTKTNNPQIEWFAVPKREGTTFMRYVEKLCLVNDDINAGRFYRRPGKWCSWCDYLPVCAGDRVKAEEMLIQLR